MMRVISAVTTSVIINVTTILIATATPVESSSSDLSSTVVETDFELNYVHSYIYKCVDTYVLYASTEVRILLLGRA